MGPRKGLGRKACIYTFAAHGSGWADAVSLGCRKAKGALQYQRRYERKNRIEIFPSIAGFPDNFS